MKLLAVDLSNLLLRHAANPYREAEDNQGRDVRGPVGALAQMIRLVWSEKPSHLLLARDGPRKNSFRREIDPEYKAHRPEADDGIRHQFAFMYDVLQELRWPLREEEGYEADDILASAAASFAGSTVIVTGDKDLLACVSQRTSVLLLRPGEVRRCIPDDVEEIFGVAPDRVCDWKALVGDPSDGISGVPGIGPQRALKLLQHFGTLDDLLSSLRSSEELSVPGISPAQLAGLRDNLHIAEQSYKLAQLHEDLDIDFASTPPMPEQEDIPRLRSLGLGALADQLFPEEAAQAKPRDLEDMFDGMW